jgi:hypothetical protein
MATAWETLTGNSTVPFGTAWVHLNNQLVGDPYPQLVDDLQIEVDMSGYDLVIDTEELVLEIDDSEFIIEVEPLEYTLEIANE